MAVTDLAKTYKGGFSAVKGVSFTVERGMVLGLLGPNGAGKTTVLRMLMGLIRPTAGTITAFGEEVRPGAPVLARIGAFVEGPGFLPHLSGAENLALYWSATGRPTEESHVAEALAIAGLGASIDRRVGTYSQGMRQRLAIAQAMLGLPDLLVLDEPTNGLDPPQIHAMRDVLRAYAANGAHGAGLQPPAGRGRADLLARRGDAPRQGGGARAPSSRSSRAGAPPRSASTPRTGPRPCSASSTACAACASTATRCTPS